MRAASVRVINGLEVGGGAGTSLHLACPGCEGIREERQVMAVAEGEGEGGGAGTAAAEEEDEEEK